MTARTIPPETIRDWIAVNIDTFHQGRLRKLEGLKLRNILKRKNPYLFRANKLVKFTSAPSA